MKKILLKLAPMGIQANAVLAEKLVATLGGCLAILCISVLSFRITGAQGAAAVVPSMGAATVLLFAMPHGQLSQPWALFIGNGLSALVGVSCAKLVPQVHFAAALAVGISIGAMHLTRSIHPPGGATALAAVIGGSAVTDLGYWYLVAPTLLNCLIIFLFAFVFNGLFAWRRYPLALAKFRPLETAVTTELKIEHLQEALNRHNITVDVHRLLPAINNALAKTKHSSGSLLVELGGVYSNDKPGAEWAVRKIIDEHHHSDPEKDIVIFLVLDGAGKRRSGSCRRYEFASWAKKRLAPVNPVPSTIIIP
jgi:CBS-domain-containing membrane protein